MVEEIQSNKIYTPKEARNFLRVSESTMKRMLKNGIIEAYKVSGQYRIWGREILGLVSPKSVTKTEKVYLGIKQGVRKKSLKNGSFLQSKNLIKPNNMSLENKIILVTGGAGFFGNKFVETVLRDHNPKSIRIYDNRELAEVEMQRKFNDSRLRFFMGDVRDKDRLHRAMNGVDIVVHAAALKHVPIAEYNPIEAIKTNINGTANVIDAAIDNNVEKAILVSSDKAVNPANLYGATKLCAEKLFTQANFYVGDRKTRFSCVRYVNVLGSCGSIIPLFLEQKKTGTLTVTHEKMTRFFMTSEQGVELVISSLKEMRGGEIFIPKTPSMKILDLAKAVDPSAKIKIIGIRPGEKLQESLLTIEEARHTKELSDRFVVEPEFDFWENKNVGGKSLPEGFYYTSDNNNLWFSKNDFKRIIEAS